MNDSVFRDYHPYNVVEKARAPAGFSSKVGATKAWIEHQVKDL